MNSCSQVTVCDDKRLLFNKNGYPVYSCKECVRRFSLIRDVDTHLSKVYSDDYFFSGGDGYPDYLEGKDMLYRYGMHYAEVVKRFTKPGRLLDVGCAAGFVLKGFEHEGWLCHGIEPNDTMASYGRNELKLDIATGSLESYTTDHSFDLINLIQVIGSLYDTDIALGNVHRLLNPNGYVLVESWNMNSLYARIMGSHWHEYCPPSVINWFSDKTLQELFSEHGFELVGMGRPAKQINLKHAFSLLRQNHPRIFNRKFVHLLTKSFGNMVINYPPLDLKWYMFRKL